MVLLARCQRLATVRNSLRHNILNHCRLDSGQRTGFDEPSGGTSAGVRRRASHSTILISLFIHFSVQLALLYCISLHKLCWCVPMRQSLPGSCLHILSNNNTAVRFQMSRWVTAGLQPRQTWFKPPPNVGCGSSYTLNGHTNNTQVTCLGFLERR